MLQQASGTTSRRAVESSRRRPVAQPGWLARWARHPNAAAHVWGRVCERATARGVLLLAALSSALHEAHKRGQARHAPCHKRQGAASGYEGVVPATLAAPALAPGVGCACCSVVWLWVVRLCRWGDQGGGAPGVPGSQAPAQCGWLTKPKSYWTAPTSQLHCQRCQVTHRACPVRVTGWTSSFTLGPSVGRGGPEVCPPPANGCRRFSPPLAPLKFAWQR